MIFSVVNEKGMDNSHLVLFATRFARKCLLEYLCPGGHPVLDVERKLLGDAQTKLHEHLLKVGWDRRRVESIIRKCAVEKLQDIVEDSAVKRSLIEIVQKKSLDEAFPEIN